LELESLGLCERCRNAPRRIYHHWCSACAREYQRGRNAELRRKRAELAADHEYDPDARCACRRCRKYRALFAGRDHRIRGLVRQ
jgi:hypothetical protein